MWWLLTSVKGKIRGKIWSHHHLFEIRLWCDQSGVSTQGNQSRMSVTRQWKKKWILNFVMFSIFVYEGSEFCRENKHRLSLQTIKQWFFFTAGSYLNNIYLLKILKLITAVYIRKLSIMPLVFSPTHFFPGVCFSKAAQRIEGPKSSGELRGFLPSKPCCCFGFPLHKSPPRGKLGCLLLGEWLLQRVLCLAEEAPSSKQQFPSFLVSCLWGKHKIPLCT